MTFVCPARVLLRSSRSRYSLYYLDSQRLFCVIKCSSVHETAFPWCTIKDILTSGVDTASLYSAVMCWWGSFLSSSTAVIEAYGTNFIGELLGLHFIMPLRFWASRFPTDFLKRGAGGLAVAEAFIRIIFELFLSSPTFAKHCLISCGPSSVHLLFVLCRLLKLDLILTLPSLHHRDRTRPPRPLAGKFCTARV